MAYNTICVLVPEVCHDIVAEYKDKYMLSDFLGFQLRMWLLLMAPWKWLLFQCLQKTLSTSCKPSGVVGSTFSSYWNNYHFLCAIYGNHVHIKLPKKSDSVYYNYEGLFAIILLDIVDVDYRFLLVNMDAWASISGAWASISDAGVLSWCSLKRKMDDGMPYVPDPDP